MGKMTIGKPSKNNHSKAMSQETFDALKLYFEQRIQDLEAKPAQVIKEIGVVEKTIETIIEKQPIQQIIKEQVQMDQSFLVKISELESIVKKLEAKLSEQKDVIQDVKEDEHNDSVYIEGLENQVKQLEKTVEALVNMPDNVSQIVRVEYKTSRPLMYLCVFNLLLTITLLIYK
jgi:chromosome segregation ATPase